MLNCFISLNTRKTGHYGFGLIQQTLFTGLFWQFVSKWVVHIGTFGGDLSQIALQAALLFNSIYATKVWASGEADNEGGTTD